VATEDRGIPKGQWLALAAIGAGIGWLVGQSATPLVASVLASVLGVLGGLLAGYAGMPGQPTVPQDRRPVPLDARPLGLVVAMLAIAATAGLYVKAHRLLEPPEIREGLLDLAARGESPAAWADTRASAVLFGVAADDCARVLSVAHTPEAFRALLRTSVLPGASVLADEISDTDVLITMTEALCDSLS